MATSHSDGTFYDPMRDLLWYRGNPLKTASDIEYALKDLSSRGIYDHSDFELERELRKRLARIRVRPYKHEMRYDIEDYSKPPSIAPPSWPTAPTVKPKINKTLLLL